MRWWLHDSTTGHYELLKLEMSWDGNPQTEDKLIALVTAKDPKLVFLMETKVKKYILERVGRRIQLQIFLLFLVSIQVVALLCIGSLTWMWMCKLSLTITLMLLSTKEWMMSGVSQGSIKFLILPAKKTLRVYFEL